MFKIHKLSMWTHSHKLKWKPLMLQGIPYIFNAISSNSYILSDTVKSSSQMLPTWILSLTPPPISWMETFNALWRQILRNLQMSFFKWSSGVCRSCWCTCLVSFNYHVFLLISTSPAVGAHVSTDEGQSNACLTSFLVDFFQWILSEYHCKHFLEKPCIFTNVLLFL